MCRKRTKVYNIYSCCTLHLPVTLISVNQYETMD
jgi:hypothetical protein